MKHSKNFKYRYDEKEGVFIRDSEISVNWLISQVLQIDNLQITKISNDEVLKLLYMLDESDLRMPDGKHSLFWLKDELDEKRKMADGKQGENWAKISERYRYILEQLDLTLVRTKNYEEKKKIVKEDPQPIYRTPNNMEACFEPK